MACAQVVGNDATVAWAGAAGNFELNVMMPVLARNLLESVRLLAAVSRLLATRCVDGLRADRARMRQLAEASPSVATPLNGYLGYEQVAAVVKRAVATGSSIADTVRAMGFVERGEISEEELSTALDVDRMTGR
jgi:fumarate hydratase class II